MENKTKLSLVITFVSILLVLIFILIYGIFFYNDTTKEVIALETKEIEEIEKIDLNNKEEYEEKVTTVILNKKRRETIQNNSTKTEERKENKKIESKETGNKKVTNSNVQNKNNNQQESVNNVKQSEGFYIKVNYRANVVTVYSKDENGKYTIPCKAFICSTGTATPTSGVYNMDYKYRWISLFGDVYGQYATRIVGNILFHSVPYLENKNPASLEYWEYDKLGTSASMGCIRLTVEDAKWIYDNCKAGTSVEFYSSDDPGPLGKPEAMKITENEECRGWDPTDPDKNNPWITILDA